MISSNPILFALIIIFDILVLMLFQYAIKILLALVLVPIKHNHIKNKCDVIISAEIVGETYRIINNKYFFSLVYKYVYNGQEYVSVSFVTMKYPCYKYYGLDDNFIKLNIDPINPYRCCWDKEIKLHTKNVFEDILMDVFDWSDLCIKTSDLSS